MSKVQEYTVPISLEIGVVKKKKYFLNLNQYAKWHFQERNQLKRLFKKEIAKDIKHLTPLKGSCRVCYTIFYPTNRKFDIDNIGSVVTKFNMDALVELGILDDDNCTVVKEITYKYGGVDRNEPRCEVSIEPF